jgi:NADH:ubiquinone oxidoreductase subunit 2 (subunit N)
MSFDLFSVYLSLEGLTLIITTLIAAHFSRGAIESGLKYIILSGFSSAFLLFSCSLFLFFFGSTSFLSIKILANSYAYIYSNNIIIQPIGHFFIKHLHLLLILFFLNFLFKLSL